MFKFGYISWFFLVKKRRKKWNPTNPFEILNSSDNWFSDQQGLAVYIYYFKLFVLECFARRKL